MMNNYLEGTFYLVTENKQVAQKLMAAFLSGENCPECESGGRYFGRSVDISGEWISGGFSCECLTYEATENIEACACDICAELEEDD